MVDKQVDLQLHPGQLQVYSDPRRYKIVIAGRRWGKSRLAIAKAISSALITEYGGYDLTDKGVFITAPTHDQAKRIYWATLLRLAQPVIKRKLENTGRIELINDRWIEVRGADKPESMRGVGLGAAILDEYANMKPIVWEEIISPALTDVSGEALFIGTPKGKNHFYNLTQDALNRPDEWGIWTFKSTDNPFLDPKEIAKARHNMTAAQFRQEYEASFMGGGTGTMKEEWFRMAPEPLGPGYYVMTCDLAGFSDDALDFGKYKRVDEHALCVTKVHPLGRHIKDIRHGRWGAREVTVQILKMAHDYGIRRIGIEKGALLNAIMGYMTDRMKAVNFFPEIIPLFHDGKNKPDRIMYGLATHGEHGRLTLELGASWISPFMEQAMDFPSKLAPDDLIDAAAYAEQMADDTFEDLATLDNESSNFYVADADIGF